MTKKGLKGYKRTKLYLKELFRIFKTRSSKWLELEVQIRADSSELNANTATES
jgi:hypothetical protein